VGCRAPETKAAAVGGAPSAGARSASIPVRRGRGNGDGEGGGGAEEAGRGGSFQRRMGRGSGNVGRAAGRPPIAGRVVAVGGHARRTPLRWPRGGRGLNAVAVRAAAAAAADRPPPWMRATRSGQRPAPPSAVTTTRRSGGRHRRAHQSYTSGGTKECIEGTARWGGAPRESWSGHVGDGRGRWLSRYSLSGVGTSHAAAATATPRYAATTAATATERTAATLTHAVGPPLAGALRRVAASLRRHPVGAVARLLADAPVLSVSLVGAGGVFEKVRGGGCDGATAVAVGGMCLPRG